MSVSGCSCIVKENLPPQGKAFGERWGHGGRKSLFGFEKGFLSPYAELLRFIAAVRLHRKKDRHGGPPFRLVPSRDVILFAPVARQDDVLAVKLDDFHLQRFIGLLHGFHFLSPAMMKGC